MGKSPFLEANASFSIAAAVGRRLRCSSSAVIGQARQTPGELTSTLSRKGVTEHRSPTQRARTRGSAGTTSPPTSRCTPRRWHRCATWRTVTMRVPPSSSPTTQVHSPDPNRIGMRPRLKGSGAPPVLSTKAFIASMCSRMPLCRGLPCTPTSTSSVWYRAEGAVPVRSVPAREIELVHTVEISRLAVVGHARCHLLSRFPVWPALFA